MATASERAAEINATTCAWIAEDPTNRGAFLLVEDATHWTEYGIETGEELDTYLAFNNYVDMFKSVNGIKPRWRDMRELDAAGWDAECRSLQEEIDAGERAEEAHRAWAKDITSPTPLTFNPFGRLSL